MPERGYTARDEAMLIRLRHEGYTWGEIGAALSRRPKTVEWYGTVIMGLLGRERFEELKETLAPQCPERPRPTAGEFELAGVLGGNNRGWGNFLEDDS